MKQRSKLRLLPAGSAALTWLLLLAAPATGAVIQGSVYYSGSPLPFDDISRTADPYCSETLSAERTPAVGSEGQVAEVFLYVASEVDSKTLPPEESTPLVIERRGCRWFPRVWGARTGRPIQVVNRDKTLHTLHCHSRTDTCSHRGLASGGSWEHTFAKPEIMVRLGCDLHPGNSSYGGIVAHPYFAVTDAQGRYRIEGLPPGKYELATWHDQLGSLGQEIEIREEGEVRNISFTYAR